ncbi:MULTISPECIES: hypothetical protein [unclassified Chelatococcus]|uniref:hypothetical protein n=1 Tax=unclassified Chelatococcus TaxID=2638111 RepID=UPI001BD10C03|nr:MULTISPECIES: hypothetical protein [unclassified Chelatococcus]CAH1657312.1 hypothetical protein CHELA20_11570 [Hyphomicrobiales bacterium]MBS7742329.1 hypothetical protein [Chelatococcus sp. HY11]MBX3542553.1 hypothetical protein [Chelatococcus sp.]MCO5075230.1 hypothetical protein [Chelatococcus sp.]CAH1689052.1 hypothetical protein CHELA41_50023 [Hyphomicrobiales bacterium]
MTALGYHPCSYVRGIKHNPDEAPLMCGFALLLKAADALKAEVLDEIRDAHFVLIESSAGTGLREAVTLLREQKI